MDYSIVIPVYFNAESVEETYKQIRLEVIDKLPNKAIQVVFVDDGSTDRSYEKLVKIQNQYPKEVKVVKLTRNFGQVSATLAGYEHAEGNALLNFSADLQDPPQILFNMISAHDKQGKELVIAYRESRKESRYRIVTSSLFYAIIRKLCFPSIPKGGFDTALVSRKVYNATYRRYDADPFWQGQLLWSGFPVHYIPYTRLERKSGESKWTLRKKIKYIVDAIAAYSFFPLRFISTIGIAIASLSFFYAFIVLIAKLMGYVTIDGWSPLMIVILVTSGIQMISLGVIGEYLWRVLNQSRNRPLYVVDKLID